MLPRRVFSDDQMTTNGSYKFWNFHSSVPPTISSNFRALSLQGNLFSSTWIRLRELERSGWLLFRRFLSRRRRRNRRFSTPSSVEVQIRSWWEPLEPSFLSSPLRLHNSVRRRCHLVKTKTIERQFSTSTKYYCNRITQGLEQTLYHGTVQV